MTASALWRWYVLVGCLDSHVLSESPEFQNINDMTCLVLKLGTLPLCPASLFHFFR